MPRVLRNSAAPGPSLLLGCPTSLFYSHKSHIPGSPRGHGRWIGILGILFSWSRMAQFVAKNFQPNICSISQHISLQKTPSAGGCWAMVWVTLGAYLTSPGLVHQRAWGSDTKAWLNGTPPSEDLEEVKCGGRGRKTSQGQVPLCLHCWHPSPAALKLGQVGFKTHSGFESQL